MFPAHAIRFVRRTSLNQEERRINFRQIDNDILAALTSDEALAVTHSMSHVYNCLVNAPIELFEQQGKLYFTGGVYDEKQITAWEQLRRLTKVAGATLKKALDWMHEQGIIGYFAGKNGVGIRIFLNRASTSIAIVECRLLWPGGERLLLVSQQLPAGLIKVHLRTLWVVGFLHTNPRRLPSRPQTPHSPQGYTIAA